MKSPSPYSDGWGEVIQFQDGWCWGIDPSGATVCCGREDDVAAILSGGKRSASPVVNDILDLEKILRKERADRDGRDTAGATAISTRIKAKRTGNFRAGLANHTKHKPFDTRRFKKR